MTFLSDTAAPAHPAILSALAAANEGLASSYGSDAWTAALREEIGQVFETDVEVWLVSSGTAANALALSIVCPPTGGIACHREAHIERDERGAPEFFTGGGKLVLLGGEHARISLGELEARLAANDPAFVHETPLHALSLSNLSESGAALTPDETRARARCAAASGLKVHLDGARFGNAVVATRSSPADLSWRAGIDLMSFGATKNGALGCEAIVLFGAMKDRIADLRVRAKRSGHMPPKQRYLAAQMQAYLKDGLWLELAGRANASAQELAQILVQSGGELAHPVDGNEVFVRLPETVQARLADAGIGFYRWLDGSCRFVCSWSTGPDDLARTRTALSARGATS